MSIVNVAGSVEYSVNLTPCTLLINTTDSLSTVMGVGYLNGTDTIYTVTYVNSQMALVNTSSGLIWLQISIVGANTSLIAPMSIPKVQTTATRTLNSAFQVNSSRNSMVNYSVDIAATISLTTGQSGTVFLEIASDSGFTTNVQTISQFTNGNAGSLTIGLNLTQTNTGCLTGFVPSGYYCRLRTANNTGTPTFTYKIGQEVLI